MTGAWPQNPQVLGFRGNPQSSIRHEIFQFNYERVPFL